MKRVIINFTEEQYKALQEAAVVFGFGGDISATVRGVLVKEF